jgi:hypothetical protein
MLRKIFPLITFIIMFLCSCGQAGDTQEPVATSPPVSLTEAPASPDSLQSQLFGLVPQGFLGAGYYNLGLIMADLDLNSALGGILFNPFQDSQLLGSVINGMLSFSMSAEGSPEAAMSIVHIFQGEFAGITLPELAQESNLEGAVLQHYQEIEIMVDEQEDPYTTAMSIIDESTMIFGEESGVKAVLDTFLGVSPSPLADLGDALPQLLTASVFNFCPQYEDLGCSGMIVPGLAQGSGSKISLLHVFLFDGPEQAANALETISADAESGNITQTGSIKISAGNVSQDGRYVIIEELLNVDEIGAIFEQ